MHNLYFCHSVHEFIDNNRECCWKMLTLYRIGHPILLFNDLYWSHLLMNTYIVCKSLHILWAFGKIYSNTYSPIVFLTNFPIIFFPNPWPSSQPMGYSTWINKQLDIWPFLHLRKMHNLVYCPKFYPPWRSHFTGIFQGFLRKELRWCSCPLVGSVCTACRNRTISKKALIISSSVNC